MNRKTSVADYNNNGLYNPTTMPRIDDMPRSRTNKDKEVKAQGYVIVRKTHYFKRIFTDGCVELVRYDFQAKMWMVLCFKA